MKLELDAHDLLDVELLEGLVELARKRAERAPKRERRATDPKPPTADEESKITHADVARLEKWRDRRGGA